MVSVGRKIPTEQKIYLFLSNLRHIGHDEFDVYVFCPFITWGGKIRRLSMNVAFKYI
jgi:hypothetical protein